MVTKMVDLQLTRRGRNLLRVLASGSLLVVIGAGFSAVSHASEGTALSTSSQAGTTPARSSAATAGYIQIVLAPGESLWSIAAIVAGNRDVSTVLDQIVKVNRLLSTDLAAGTRLLIPTR